MADQTEDKVQQQSSASATLCSIESDEVPARVSSHSCDDPGREGYFGVRWTPGRQITKEMHFYFFLWLQNCCNCYMQVYKRKSLLQVFQIVTSFGNEFLWKGNFVLTLVEYRRISDRVLLLLLGGLGLPVLISLLSILIEKNPLNFEQNVILIWCQCVKGADCSETGSRGVSQSTWRGTNLALN